METEQTTLTPSQRAEIAAEALTAEGQNVTNDAVRERAGVGMNVAAEAARKWKAHAVAAKRRPEAPAEWRARLDALWPTALDTATAEFDGERGELMAKLQSSDDENQALTDEVIASEAQIEELKAVIAETERVAAVREEEFAAEREDLTAKLQASEDQNQTLTNDLAKSEVRIGELKTAVSDAKLAASIQAREHVVELSAEKSRASRAEGSLEAVSAERDRLLAEVQAGRSGARD